MYSLDIECPHDFKARLFFEQACVSPVIHLSIFPQWIQPIAKQILGN